MFDKIISRKQLKELKTNLSDDEIETYKINKQLTEILEYNCKRLSKHFGYEITYNNKTIYIKSKSRYIELLVNYKDVILEYESAKSQIEYDINNRLYYSL